jgi:septal ring factor EnvC (AmiA/AmiB activator)
MNAADRPVKNISADLAQLQTVAQKLSSEINHLHHELRRIRDALERTGGSGHELEKNARLLSANIKLCESELKENQKQQDQISKQIPAQQKFERDETQ